MLQNDEKATTPRMVGFPEASIPLGFAVIDLALSPKSKNAYIATAKVR